ncbi:DUF3253 domain-containing protein [Tahibacter sp.]|uniref:DUF3253 domain-containing protein n=1 Tax=Tahibacter sp. TaxID=2056211 RepID=UPI0028C42DB1|nr:DUF3253 domain-containing protein [Tahibacter sp.]
MAVDTNWPPFASRFRYDDSLAVRTRECLLELLRADGGGGLCPTDAARLLADSLCMEWRELMRPVRLVAVELAREGLLEILQNGEHVNILDARGPVRLHYRGR